MSILFWLLWTTDINFPIKEKNESIIFKFYKELVFQQT